MTMKERILLEDALKHIHFCEYHQQAPTVESLAGALSSDRDLAYQIMAKLESSDLVTLKDGTYCLTPEGRDYARHVIRAHRLYETHLAQETGLSEVLWHHEAERREHEISEIELARMARRLGDPRFDPHGDPIPTPSGDLPPLRGRPLLQYPVGWVGKVVHIEDEPAGIYSELIAAGLAPGVRIRVLESDHESVQLNAEGRTLPLSRSAALNVMVAELEDNEAFDEHVARLSSLRAGEKAAIVGLSPACRGPERSRLLDLGVVPGTVVEMDIRSPSGNPTAYVIRGASIALRQDQAERILVKKA